LRGGKSRKRGEKKKKIEKGEHGGGHFHPEKRPLKKRRVPRKKSKRVSCWGTGGERDRNGERSERVFRKRRRGELRIKEVEEGTRNLLKRGEGVGGLQKIAQK